MFCRRSTCLAVARGSGSRDTGAWGQRGGAGRKGGGGPGVEDHDGVRRWGEGVKGGKEDRRVGRGEEERDWKGGGGVEGLRPRLARMHCCVCGHVDIPRKCKMHHLEIHLSLFNPPLSFDSLL